MQSVKWEINLQRSNNGAIPTSHKGEPEEQVIDVDICSEWSKALEEKYDLVIFRHTLEHLEDPNLALNRSEIHFSRRDGIYCCT